MTQRLRQLSPADVASLRRNPVDDKVLERVQRIVDGVRHGGDAALLQYRAELDGMPAHEPIAYDKQAMKKAADSLVREEIQLLQRVAGRIREFAKAQLACCQSMQVSVPGGAAGHEWAPVDAAGCYAPGGRYPLPSTILMTAAVARTAGVTRVVVASPNCSPVMLAAAHVAEADEFLAVGGAQAIAAMAWGTETIAPCDVLAGPGNRWVTAAKFAVSNIVRIDMLAGPSELVIVADDSADPANLAADLLAQAEHDPHALPILISLSPNILPLVNRELERQLANLPTGDVAAQAIANGFSVLASDVAEAGLLSDRLAPEHLQLCVTDAARKRQYFHHYGAIFLGCKTAEVVGDYGLGPNHVLPTGGASRFTGGLSVATFLRQRTWIEIQDLQESASIQSDSAFLARLEGLIAHERSAQRRLESRQ